MRCQTVLRDIHTSLKEMQEEEIILPEQPFEDQLVEYGLSRESLKSMEFEEFE